MSTFTANNVPIYTGPGTTYPMIESSSTSFQVTALWKEGTYLYIDYVNAAYIRRRGYVPSTSVNITETLQSVSITNNQRYVVTAATTYNGPATSGYPTTGNLSKGTTVKFLNYKSGSFAFIEFTPIGSAMTRGYIAETSLGTAPPTITVTSAQLATVGFQYGVSSVMVSNLNLNLANWGIKTAEQIRNFLAQTCVESGYGGGLLEGRLVTYTYDYCNANYLNLPNPTTGQYGGGGFIQLTGSGNYSSYAAKVGDSAISSNGAKYVAAFKPWDSAGYYWNLNGNSGYSIKTYIDLWVSQGVIGTEICNRVSILVNKGINSTNFTQIPGQATERNNCFSNACKVF